MTRAKVKSVRGAPTNPLPTHRREPSPPPLRLCRPYSANRGAFQRTYGMLLATGDQDLLGPWAKVLRSMLRLREWSRMPEATSRLLPDARLVSRYVRHHGADVATLFGRGQQGAELSEGYERLDEDFESADAELLDDARSTIEHYHNCAVDVLMYGTQREQRTIAAEARRVRQRARQRPGDARPLPALLVAHWATRENPAWYSRPR